MWNNNLLQRSFFTPASFFSLLLYLHFFFLSRVRVSISIPGPRLEPSPSRKPDFRLQPAGGERRMQIQWTSRHIPEISPYRWILVKLSLFCYRANSQALLASRSFQSCFWFLQEGKLQLWSHAKGTRTAEK